MVDPIKTQTHSEIINLYYFNGPGLFEIYKKCVPPKEAYYYFPKGEDVIVYNEKNPEKTLRRIYINVPYSNLEKKWISDYKKILSFHEESESFKFDDYYWEDDVNLMFINTKKEI